MPESSEDRILYLLKSRGPQTAAAVAERLAMTSVGARKHLRLLEGRGLVDVEERRESVGRPKHVWSLTEAGHGRFPDSHSDLTVDLLEAVRAEFGEAGLDRLISRREAETLASYRDAMADCEGLEARTACLAELRAREGYMAEWRAEEDGSFLFVENHCPICAAARACQGLCRSELEVFQAALGAGVEVSREDHILAGARRCAYRIAQKEVGDPKAA